MSETRSPRSPEQGVYNAPWEKTFDRILTPFEEFIHRQTTSSILLMITAVVALVLANGPLAGLYRDFTHVKIGFSFGGFELKMTLHHWVNDGLMAFFFFVVGLELKREMLVGELRDPRKALMPIAAATGGMVVPALIYYALNAGGEGVRGWGIPMATDIAFAIGALALLAGRVPGTLITFLVALAIVDDLGAVLVIAIFYTDQVMLTWLWIVAGLVGLLVVFNLAGIRAIAPYFLVAIGLWYAMLQSGVHATLAGVIGAFTVPAMPKYDPLRFSSHVRELMEEFDHKYQHGRNILTNDGLRAIVQTLENGVHRVESPLQRLEHMWHLPVAYLVIPVFALVNAGIPIDFGNMGAAFNEPVTMGVVLGLVLGKFVGIGSAGWLVWKLGWAQLPHGTRFSQILGVALLAGIGFTMSIFIAELGFAAHPDLLLNAKTGILAGSLLAGIGGYVWLFLASGRRREADS